MSCTARRLAASLYDLLLARRCLLCRGPSTANLCAGCDADLPALGESCWRCGVPFDFAWSGSPGHVPEERVCGACTTKPPPYDRTVAALAYAFPVPVLVQRYKFSRNLACGTVLADRLTRVLGRCPDLHADVIVPVPLHAIRQFRRVFNQADVLARDLGRALSLPVVPRILRRRRSTAAQSGLTAAERRMNLKRAFLARPLAGENVALVDDVMTTGSTVAECAVTLKRAGAGAVSVWVPVRAAG